MKTYDISDLESKPLRDRVAEFAQSLPAGKGVKVADVARQIGCSSRSARMLAQDLDLVIYALMPGQGGSTRVLVAHPDTVAAWKKANPHPPI